MAQIDDLSIFKPPPRITPTPDVVELPRTGIAVLDDPVRYRDGDILSPVAERTESRLPIALRGINLEAITSRADLMAALTLGLPQNEYNMPKFLYRPDLLDPTLFCGEHSLDGDQEARFREMQETLNAAVIPLNYHEGYAAFEDGSPIWAQMSLESGEDYSLFQKYLELPGARQLSLLPIHTTTTTLIPGSAERRASSLMHTNYWGIRAKAHDVFAVVHAQRMREQRILKSTDKHFLKSEELFNKLMVWADKLDWDALEGDPEKFVKVMDMLVKIQRTALGLSIHGNAKDEDVRSPSVELVMRSITRHAAEGAITERKDGHALDVRGLLENPEALEQAQELILRFGGK